MDGAALKTRDVTVVQVVDTSLQELANKHWNWNKEEDVAAEIFSGMPRFGSC